MSHGSSALSATAPRGRVAVAVFLLLAAAAGRLGAQGLVLQPLGGEIGLRGASTSSPSSQRLSGAEWVRLNIRGAILDPRILRFNIGLRPGLEQSRLDAGTAEGQLSATDLGLDLGAGLFQGSSPVWFAGSFLRRSRAEKNSGIFGDDRFALNTHAAAEGHFDNPFMPISINYSYEDWSQRLPESGATVPNYTWKTIRLAGASSKTSIFLERRTSEAPTYYVNDLGSLENNQTWGKGSRLQVRANGQRQSGDFLIPTRDLDGFLTAHLQHTRTFGTDWSFGLGASDIGGVPVDRRSAELGLTWRTTSWLSLGAHGNTLYQENVGLIRTARRAGPRTGVGLSLPLGAAFSFTGEVAREWLSVEATGGSRAVVTGEQHTFSNSGTIQLTSAGVDPATVVVRGAAGVYQLGLDYTVVETGGFVEIVLVPGGRIGPGETVFVDYEYALVGIGEATSLWANYSGDLRIRWFRLYHRRWLRDPSTDIPDDPLIGIRYSEQVATGVLATFQQRRATAVVMAERRHNVEGPFRLDASLVGANLTVRTTTRLSLGLQARYQFGKSPTSQNDLGMGTLSADWTPHSTLRLSGNVSAWQLTQDRVSRSTEFGGNVRATWQPGLLQTTLYYFYRTWEAYRIGAVADRPAQDLSRLTLEIRRSF
jgi:hypothetical protein